MKHFIKGMTLLLAGVSFMACSKDVAFDENAQKQAEEAKAEAELAQKYASYETAFVKKFGSIAKGQDWGFGQTRGITTRGESFPGEKHKNDAPLTCDYDIPDNVTSEKEGGSANLVQSLMNDGVDNVTFIFNNYWMQHYNKAQGNHQKMKAVEAYDSSTNSWITVSKFSDGQNNSVTYYTKNKQSKGTTLMTGMGGAGCDGSTANGGDAAKGKLFRWKKSDGTYCYDYKFVVVNGNLFLGLKYNDADWWVILITKAIAKTNEADAEGRVMCEDMGEIGDFDFNDVVFDAKIWPNGDITIDVLAAGGILPITIDGTPVSLGEMTNTGVNTAGTQSFTISAVNGMPKYGEILDIPVVVNPGGNAKKYELKADVETAPQKICTFINTRWPDEYVSIERAYTQFGAWVQANDPTKWIEVEVEDLTDRNLGNNN